MCCLINTANDANIFVVHRHHQVKTTYLENLFHILPFCYRDLIAKPTQVIDKCTQSQKTREIWTWLEYTFCKRMLIHQHACTYNYIQHTRIHISPSAPQFSTKSCSQSLHVSESTTSGDMWGLLQQTGSISWVMLESLGAPVIVTIMNTAKQVKSMMILQ